MADVVRTIGSGGFFSTIAEWNAALGGTAGGAGDNAIGELIDASYSITSTLTISNTTPDTITLRAASTNRHDGTEDGAGATITFTMGANAITVSGTKPVLFEGFRAILNHSGQTHNTGIQCISAAPMAANGLFIVGSYGSCNSNTPYGLYFNSTATSNCYAINCVITRIFNSKATQQVGYGIRSSAGNDNLIVCNNTVHDCGYGIALESGLTGATTRNNASTSNFTADYLYNATGTATNNLSSDTSAPGTSAVTSTAASSLYTDLTVGTLDFHLVSGSTAADGAGADLGTTPTGIENDFDWEARPASNWDIGADQHVVTTVTGSATPIAPAATSASSAAVTVAATGAPIAPAATSAATVTVDVDGTGASIAAAATSSVTAAVAVDATATPIAPAATSSATATVATEITATATPIAPAAAVATSGYVYGDPTNVSITDARAIALADQEAAQANAGSIVIYTAGSGVPANADTALTDQATLATLTLQNPAYANASMVGDEAVAAINAVSATASGSGVAAFYRVFTSGATVLRQGTVTGTGGGGDLELQITTIGAGQTVQIS